MPMSCLEQRNTSHRPEETVHQKYAQCWNDGENFGRPLHSFLQLFLRESRRSLSIVSWLTCRVLCLRSPLATNARMSLSDAKKQALAAFGNLG